LHLGSFALSSLPVMLRYVFWKPDMIVVIEPSLFCAPVAWLMERLSSAKCWLHLQDFEVDAAFDRGIIRFAWMKGLVSAFERWMMRRFDTVSTIANSMLNRLREKGVGEPVLFSNWTDLSRMQFDIGGRESFRSGLGIEDGQCLFLYSGNIAVKQGLEVVLEAAVRLPSYRFVICGDGASRKALVDSAYRMRLSNLTFMPLQPLENLPAMLSAADIHLVIQKAGAAGLVMPSKLTNILAIGGIVLVTAEIDSELGHLADGGGACVYRCDPEDSEDLIKSIVWLQENRDVAEKIAANAKVYANRYIAMDQVLGEFEQKIKEMVR